MKSALSGETPGEVGSRLSRWWNVAGAWKQAGRRQPDGQQILKDQVQASAPDSLEY